MGWTRQEVLDVARSTGQPVVEAWSDHDAGQMGTVVGPMLHHTGSAWSYPRLQAPTLRTVREGRSDLPNSLCMYYIDYEGVIYCISEKLSWHAGAGLWAGITDGNGHYAGIEAESDGKQWTKATTASYKKLAAAILRKTGRGVAYAPRHADYALPPGRKTDFSGINPATFLADVNADLSGNPATSEEDDLTPEQDRKLAEVHRLLGVLTGYSSNIANQNEASAADVPRVVVDNNRLLGVLLGWKLPATEQEAAALAALRTDGTAPAPDPRAFAELLRPMLMEAVQAGMAAREGADASALADELAKRLAA